MNLNILYGPPGSGKTTVVQSLLKTHSFHYLSIGEIYRKEQSANSTFGKELRKYVDADLEYPKDVIYRMVQPYFHSVPKNEKLILDGFPKHQAEVEVLQNLLAESSFDIDLGSVINLEIDIDRGIKRMSSRFVCPRCDFHGSELGSCPRCHYHELTKRTDDNEAEFTTRFQTYIRNNAKIINQLKVLGFSVKKIDASLEKAKVYANVEAALYNTTPTADGNTAFKEMSGLDCEIISTVDHPYLSPPVRLLDSHKILMEINKKQPVTLLNWDVSQPNLRTYKYDLQLDLLVIGRSKENYAFNDTTPFALQTSQFINLNNYDELLTKTLHALVQAKKITGDQSNMISGNYIRLRENIFEKIVSDNILCKEYTKTILINFNKLIDRDNVADFIDKKYTYYYESPLMRSWIPYCIEKISGKRDIDKLLKAGVFSRRLFRAANSDVDYLLLAESDTVEHKHEIADLIRVGKVIPSIELLYWTLEYAGIKHFGNDHGFFERYGNYLGLKLDNQMTNPGEDGQNPFVLDRDYGFNINSITGKLVSKDQDSSVKTSRVNSIFALYLLLGDEMKEINKPDFLSPKTVSIESSVS